MILLRDNVNRYGPIQQEARFARRTAMEHVPYST